MLGPGKKGLRVRCENRPGLERAGTPTWLSASLVPKPHASRPGLVRDLCNWGWFNASFDVT